MTRRRRRHAALCLLVLTTAPIFGLLCRGRSPSRFETANLPVWERTPPHPAPARVALRPSPLLPDALPTGGPSESEMTRCRPDDLLSVLEHPSPDRPSPTGAGRPGLWLLAACPPGSPPAPTLRAQQEAVAQRLMEAQRGDGYLAAGTGAGRWSRAQVTAHGQNLRGLLAYYAASHEPAAVYTAMLAGDLVLKRFADIGTDAGRTDSLVSPMTLLSQATGDGRYRDWAVRRAQAGLTDGAGLCALYAATGERRYLHGAQRLWRQECARHQTDQDLAASLWALTGSPGYAKSLRPAAAPGHAPAAARPGGAAT